MSNSEKKTKTSSIIRIILFILTIISVPVAMSILFDMEESNLFGSLGVIYCGWVVLLALPISVASIVVEIIYRKKEKNNGFLIVAIISAFMLVLVGVIQPLYYDVKQDSQEVLEISEATGVEFPKEIKYLTETKDDSVVTVIVIEGEEEKLAFERTLVYSHKWTREPNAEAFMKLPKTTPFVLELEDYFLLYENSEEKLENTDFVMLSYNAKEGRLMILRVLKAGDTTDE